MVGIVVLRLAAARRIGHPGQAVLRKPATPLADRRRSRRQPLGHRLVAQPLVQRQNNLRPECQPLLGLAGCQPRLQCRALLAGQCHCCCSHYDSLIYPLTFATRY